jgi:hypothetical protein
VPTFTWIKSGNAARRSADWKGIKSGNAENADAYRGAFLCDFFNTKFVFIGL